MTDYSTDLKRYVASPNEKAVAGIVKHLGIALKSADASLVSCSSKEELSRVRDSWLKKKLAVAGEDGTLDAAMKDVCEKMKDDKNKQRVTFYYLLAEKFGKLEELAK
ncbi:MAG: DUF2853 family protein [Hyphomicrobiaceae bacterium]